MKKKQLCDQVVEYLLTREEEELATLTVESIARVFNVSHSFLNRKFKNEREFPLREYLFREKMARSAFLLLEDKESTIKDISKKLGYLDIDYFSFLFRNFFGISPGKYRECKKDYTIKKKKKKNGTGSYG